MTDHRTLATSQIGFVDGPMGAHGVPAGASRDEEQQGEPLDPAAEGDVIHSIHSGAIPFLLKLRSGAGRGR